jgi:hypothetical protein
MPTHLVWQIWTPADGRSRRRAVQVEYGRGSGIMRRGRRRKPNVIRDRTGKSRGEHAVAAEVLAMRARDLLSDQIAPEHAQDALAGFTLGRLLLRGRADPSNPGSITQAQYDAGDDWSEIVRAHARLMGYSLTSTSPSFELVKGGLSCDSDPQRTEVMRIRRKYSDCYRALIDAGTVFKDYRKASGLEVAMICWDVCIDNRPLGTLSAADYGNLRAGLNALVKALR